MKISSNMLSDITRFVDRGALFVINHSGGKDSQAMTLLIRHYVPAEQIVVIHAELPEVDWPDTISHIWKTAGDLPVHMVRARKTFFEMVRARGRWPSPKYRQCTSDLKRGPLEKCIRALVKNRPNKLIVNCVGLRADESAQRSRRPVLAFNARNSKAGREWWDFHPIHDWTTFRVFEEIAQAGQNPHWAYAAGMTRLSCCFCIMSSKADLKTAAILRPHLLDQYARLETEIDQTFIMPGAAGRRFLPEIIGDSND